jgi:multiple antibiotic resistance protein
MLRQLFNEFVTFLVVVNPIGKVPLFISITRHESAAERRQIATKAVIVAAAILLGFIAVGQVLLGILGIELVSFQVAGGLVLLIIALRMVLEEVPPIPDSAVKARGNVAVFPLALPFIAGPVSILAAILLTDDDVYTVIEQVETAGVMLLVLAITYACLIGANYVQRVLGDTGANVVGRVMGLILAALAVQSILTGLHGFRFG